MRKNDRFFRSAGFGEGTPQQVLTAAKIRLPRILGHRSILALSKEPIPPRHFFHVSSSESNRIPMKNAVEEKHADAKNIKNKGRHQAKDHAQLFMLRVSFLDLIPALCFRIHRREDGSLCQGIQLIGRHKTDIRDEFQRNDRITLVPDQCKLPFALRTVDDEFRIIDFFQRFNWDQV